MDCDLELEAFLREALAEYEEKRRERHRRSAHSYVVDLIEILVQCGERGMARGAVIEEMERRRRAERLPIPRSFDESVQSAFNQHCVQSSVFLKRKAAEPEGLFTSRWVDSSCVWVVVRGRAVQWLRTRETKLAFKREVDETSAVKSHSM
jgi:hypothetical protein